MGVGRWARLLSKSQFGIEQKPSGDIELRISQTIGDTVYYCKYIVSRYYADDEHMFGWALDEFLERFDNVMSDEVVNRNK